MIISCMGHAKFVIELDNGLRIVTDPYDASCGYPVTANPADVVLVSHQHHDHNAVETIPGNPRVIDRAGDFDLGGGAAVRAIEAYHDEQQGKLRGKTLLFCLKAEGLTVMHLGDLGHMLTTEQRLLLGSADIVMLPVGGYYTMDAPMAKQVADVLHARVILPMHYKTEANASWPIAPVTDFLRLYPEKAEELPLLFERFHKSDKSRSEDKDGVGLGLYIVKTILEQHKEHIAVTSENGLTTFTFTITLAGGLTPQ